MYHDKEWLRKKYIDEGLSSREIGKICHADHSTIHIYLRKFNIKRIKEYLNKNWLVEHYINKKLSTLQIGDICNVGGSTINRNLKKFDIPIRSLSEAFLGITRKRTKEHNQKIGQANKGKVYSKEVRKKLSKSLLRYFKTHEVSKKTREKISKANKGKYVSEDTRNKMSGENNYFYGKHFIGNENPNWKGGITSLIETIRNNEKYKEWRELVFKRDNFACQICGDNKGGNLNAHHIKPLLQLIQYYEITTLEEALNCAELWNINNGITLCEKCHIKIHKKKVLVNV